MEKQSVHDCVPEKQTSNYHNSQNSNAKDVNDAFRHKAVKESAGDLLTQTHRPVLLTSMDIRRYVRKLIEMELYDLPVLSHQELTEEITIRPLGRIQLS